MAELEERLNAILENQEMMGQIMALARSLSEGSSPPEEEEGSSGLSPQNSGLSGRLGELDPDMVRLGMELVGQLSKQPDRTTALLQALRPFLREERQAKVDRALQIAPMLRVLRLAMRAAGGRGMAEDV